MPECYLFNIQRINDLDENATVVVPWAHLLHDTTVTCIWREAETSWVGVEDGHPSGILPAPVVLMAHPCAAILAGSGDAIAWLESWQSQQPHARTVKTVESKRGRATSGLEQPPQSDESPRKKQRISTSGSSIVLPRDHAEPEFLQVLDESPRKKPCLTAYNATRSPATSDDEPDFVEGSSSGTPRKRKWKTVYDGEGREIIDLT